jgi:dUTP pyrophosphatase
MKKRVKIDTSNAYDIPEYKSELAAGMDLYANNNVPLMIKPGCRVLVPTGIRLEMPKGMEAQIRPRSGLVLKHGVTVLNSPGTVDADYRGEIGVILYNADPNSGFIVKRGDRIAQIVFASCIQAKLVECRLNETARGSGGFGSTGK